MAPICAPLLDPPTSPQPLLHLPCLGHSSPDARSSNSHSSFCKPWRMEQRQVAGQSWRKGWCRVVCQRLSYVDAHRRRGGVDWSCTKCACVGVRAAGQHEPRGARPRSLRPYWCVVVCLQTGGAGGRAQVTARTESTASRGSYGGGGGVTVEEWCVVRMQSGRRTGSGRGWS